MTFNHIILYEKMYLFLDELAISQRSSAVFCATGAWGGKPIGRVLVKIKNFVKCISKFPLIFGCRGFLDLLQTRTSWIKMCFQNKFPFLNRSKNYQFRKMFQQRLFHTQKCHFLDFIICTNEEKRKITGFEKLLGFGRSHSFVTRGSVTLSCATTLHHSCFSKFSR